MTGELEVCSLAGEVITKFEAQKTWTRRNILEQVIQHAAPAEGCFYRFVHGETVVRKQRTLKDCGVIFNHSEAARIQAIVMPKPSDADLELVRPALEEAMRGLNSVHVNDVKEIRALAVPPPGVSLCIEAVLKVLGEPTPKGGHTWTTVKAHLKDPDMFLNRLKNFDKDEHYKRVVEVLKPYLEQDIFTYDRLRCFSQMCGHLVRWCSGMNRYCTVLQIMSDEMDD